MAQDKKKYVCLLPTNGFQPGQEAWLTDDELANANGGEASPRFELAEDQSGSAPAEEPKTDEAQQ